MPRELIPSDLMSAYLLFIQARRRPGTAITYTSDIRRFRLFLAQVGGVHRKREIGPRLLDHYLVWMRGEGLAPATLERRLQVLRSFFKWAVSRRYLRDDPFLAWEIPRAPKPLPRALSPGQDLRLLRSLEGPLLGRYQRMVALGIRLGRFAGFRVGECGRIAWEDADLTKRILIVRDSKGGQDRAVPIPVAGLARPLATWLEAEGRPSRGPILTGRFRRRLHADALREAAGKWFRAAGAVDATFHALRATYATRLMELGVPPTVIQRLLGHKNLNTTMRYLAVSDEGKREAADLLDQDLPASAETVPVV